MPPSTPFVLPPTPPHAGAGLAFSEDVDHDHHDDRAALYPLETTASPRSRAGLDARIKLAGTTRTSARWSPAAHAAARLRRRAAVGSSSPALADVNEILGLDEDDRDANGDAAWRSSAPLAHPAPMHSPPLSPDMVIATPRRGALADLSAHRNDARRSASASPPGKENARAAPTPAPTTPPWLLAWNLAKRARQSPNAAVREVDSAHVTDVDEDEDDSAVLDMDDFEEEGDEDEGGSEESDDVGPIVFPQRHKPPFGTAKATPVPDLFARLPDDLAALSETDDEDEDGRSDIGRVAVHDHSDSDDDEIVFLGPPAVRRHADDVVPPRHHHHAVSVPVPALPLAVRPRSVLRNKLANAWDHAAAPIRRRMRGRSLWIVATTVLVMVLVSVCASWLVVVPQGAVVPQGSVLDPVSTHTPTSTPIPALDPADPAAARVLAEKADLCARTALGTLRPAAPTPICDSPLPILAAPFARAHLLAHAVYAYLLSASTVHDTTRMAAALDALIWTRAADGIGGTVVSHARLATAMDRLVRAMITAHARAEVVVDDELRDALRAVVSRVESATHSGVAMIEAVHLDAHVDRVAREWSEALEVVIDRADAVVNVADEVGGVEVAVDAAVERAENAVREFRDRVVSARKAMQAVVDRRGVSVEEVLGGPVSTVKEVQSAVQRIETVIAQAKAMVRAAKDAGDDQGPVDRDAPRVAGAGAP
ncbi:hypothetical protein GGF31_008962 [Allomyces arbusculus]|nr:hypothetical protein GGF31_008962 [Allomyces arbusculus]